MKRPTFGQEIKRLRLQADVTLRKLAEELEISAAHLSDIEHDRRRPSKDLLERMVARLKHVGATLEGLDRLDTRIDRETQSWVAETPGVGEMLRQMRTSGEDPLEILHLLRQKGKGWRKKEGG